MGLGGKIALAPTRTGLFGYIGHRGENGEHAAKRVAVRPRAEATGEQNRGAPHAVLHLNGIKFTPVYRSNFSNINEANVISTFWDPPPGGRGGVPPPPWV